MIIFKSNPFFFNSVTLQPTDDTSLTALVIFSHSLSIISLLMLLLVTVTTVFQSLNLLSFSFYSLMSFYKWTFLACGIGSVAFCGTVWALNTLIWNRCIHELKLVVPFLMFPWVINTFFLNLRWKLNLIWHIWISPSWKKIQEKVKIGRQKYYCMRPINKFKTITSPFSQKHKEFVDEIRSRDTLK